MRKTILTTFGIIFVVISIYFVSAAGLISPYWSDNPLNMYYGETKIIEFTLQNMVGNEDITVKASITEGNDIASLEQDTFTAKAQTEDTKIPVKITIPENYGKSMQRVRLDVNTITSGEGGMVKLGTGWSTAFNVMLSTKPIEEKPKTTLILTLIIIILIAIIIVLVLFLLKSKKAL